MPTLTRRPALAAGLIALTLGAAAACGSSSSGGGSTVSPAASSPSRASGPLHVSPFQTQDQANLAISSGRADVGMADSPVAAYIVKQSNGAFKISGQAYGTAPYGIAMSKKGTLDQAVLAAIKDLMSDGQYYAILQKWNITSGGISNPQINGATQTIQPATAPSSSTAPTVDAAAAKLLPSSLQGGTLKVAADASYAPDEFFAKDGKTVIGMDADLAQAIGKVLGLKVTVSNVAFDAIIPAIQNGRYDLGMSSFTDTADREKQVNFVTYFSAGTSFYVAANGGPNIQTLADLCGHTVAVEAGTTEETDAKAQAKKC
ncbi:MAG TPA: transporter substrate-binding domain-containing protein [Mycobacteriales bacterium]|nr:transporter substrate-binding domain-containing protein [Mycobacteriales bacterium]